MSENCGKYDTTKLQNHLREMFKEQRLLKQKLERKQKETEQSKIQLSKSERSAQKEMEAAAAAKDMVLSLKMRVYNMQIEAGNWEHCVQSLRWSVDELKRANDEIDTIFNRELETYRKNCEILCGSMRENCQKYNSGNSKAESQLMEQLHDDLEQQIEAKQVDLEQVQQRLRHLTLSADRNRKHRVLDKEIKDSVMLALRQERQLLTRLSSALVAKKHLARSALADLESEYGT